MNKIDFVLITITAVCIAYVIHIWWSRKHDSLINSPHVAIVQIMGILIVTKAVAEVLDSYLRGGY